MPNNAEQNFVSPESLERRHEVSEKRVRNILIIGGAAAFLLVLSLLVCGAMIREFAQYRPMQNMRPLGLIIAPNLKPLERFPKPILQIDDDHGQMTKLYVSQQAELNSYGWINRSNGIVRIPIERAMDLILQRGLPTRTNSASQTDGSELQLIQNIPKQR
jgi:hypothetical protein